VTAQGQHGRIALGALLALLAGTPMAANWPQWRGPAGLGVSTESDLPTTWSMRENVAWSAALRGLGSSSPIVWQDQIFVTSQSGRLPLSGGSHPMLARDDAALVSREKPIGGRRDESSGGEPIFLVVESFNRADGRRLWEYRLEARGPFPNLHEKHNLATPTPVTNGEHVFAWFGTGQILALDMRGSLVWSKHLGEEYSPFDINWGHGSSPVLYRDLLILLCDHESASYLVALDARTGKQRWKADRGKGRASYSTPLVVPGPKGDELLVNSSERIDGYDPASGELLWHADAPRQSPIPSAVFHDGLIYMTRGYRNSPYLAIRPGGRGDVTASHVLWRAPGGGSYAASLVSYEGLLYLTNDVGVLTCADAKTGERIWQMRLDGVFFASPVAGDGKIYFVSQTGETVVVKAGREPAILARNDLGERLVASPAISNGRIFLRSDGRLFAIGEGSQPAKPPHPPSPVIARMEFDFTTHQRHAPGSDNWPTTWADDGHLYSAWGDGGGFGGTNSSGRVLLGVARIEGDPPHYTGKNVWGGFEPERPAQFGGKSYGILSVDGVLYMWVAPQPNPHLEHCRVAWSRDRGRTWQLAEWRFTFEDALTIPTFLNFGRDYAGARDGYVYSYYIQPAWGPERATKTTAHTFDVHRPGRIYLSRVPKAAIVDHNQYEFVSGLSADGQPEWSADRSKKRPVFEDPNGVGWNVSVSYNPGLRRYLLSTEHTETHAGKLGIFDAPEPWGPWATVAYEEMWGAGHIEPTTFYWNFTPKWLSRDGTRFTMIFTGSRTNDSWNTVAGRFIRK
jgi:outer membrane protein assembly factor BamB